MRGISGVVRAAGGRFPIGGGGPGKRGATRFTPRTGSGSVSFSSAPGPGSASSAPGQGGVILKAAVTCAGLGIVGDVLAQTITNRSTAKAAKWLKDTTWKHIGKTIDVVKDFRYLGAHITTRQSPHQHHIGR